MIDVGFRYRRRIGLGPFRLNLSRSGASVSAKIGPVTLNPTRRSAWVNLPGGSYYQKTIPKPLTGTRARRHYDARHGDNEGVRVALHGVHNRDGAFWSQAPLPRRWHKCTVWSSGHLSSGTHVERCACGACRLDGGPWMAKNSRRH